MSDSVGAKALKVFIVENHADTMQTLKVYLEEMGHEVKTAATVAQAVNVLPKIDCDVLICDIGLPDGMGWEVMEKSPKEIYAVAMSGFGMNADSARSRAAGFRHHLLKPFKAAELDKILIEAADEKSRRELRP